MFKSEPAGAVVRIDGRGIGLTPLRTDLAPGRHRITLEHSHYRPAVIDLSLERGDRVERQVLLQRGTGRLALLSNPIGAWVELDGVRQAGVTPMEVLTISGPVQIRMGLPERRVQAHGVIVLADDLVSANLSLDMDPHGSLAEWEYVARAGTAGEYWFGDDPARLCEFANLADRSTKAVYRDWAVIDCDDGFGRLAPIGQFPANPFGVHDVHGNVSEWVLECGMPEYRYADEDGTLVMKGQSCNTHGVRGGSWDSQAEALRSRRRGYARHRGDDRGIRVLKEL